MAFPCLRIYCHGLASWIVGDVRHGWGSSFGVIPTPQTPLGDVQCNLEGGQVVHQQNLRPKIDIRHTTRGIIEETDSLMWTTCDGSSAPSSVPPVKDDAEPQGEPVTRSKKLSDQISSKVVITYHIPSPPSKPTTIRHQTTPADTIQNTMHENETRTDVELMGTASLLYSHKIQRSNCCQTTLLPHQLAAWTTAPGPNECPSSAS